jgi:hypothetical protein
LANRTVYVIGNSIARQTAFGLEELLGARAVARESQKATCLKSDVAAGQSTDSCEQQWNGIQFKYLYLEWIDGYDYTSRGGFPFYKWLKTPTATSEPSVIGGEPQPQAHWVTGPVPGGNTPDFASHNPYIADWWQDDNCIYQVSRRCLKHFFAGAKEEDVLIFNVGLPYSHPRLEAELQLAMAGTRTQHVGASKNPDISVNFRDWLVSSAINFKAHIASAFPGQVFRMTLSSFNTTNRISFGSKTGNMHKNDYLKNVNDVLWDVWKPASEERPWRTVDQWAINWGREYYYEDHLHFNGVLTHAFLYQVLNELCPGRGDPEPVSWPSNPTDRDKSSSSSSSSSANVTRSARTTTRTRHSLARRLRGVPPAATVRKE